MVTMEQITYYPKSLFNGNCFANFKYNNTASPKEILIFKVLAAAAIAGLIAKIVGIIAAPIAMILTGLVAFTYLTAHGKNPPSQEFIDYAVLKAKSQAQEELPGFSEI